jgi:hypothetical protein
MFLGIAAVMGHWVTGVPAWWGERRTAVPAVASNTDVFKVYFIVNSHLRREVLCSCLCVKMKNTMTRRTEPAPWVKKDLIGETRRRRQHDCEATDHDSHVLVHTYGRCKLAPGRQFATATAALS